MADSICRCYINRENLPSKLVEDAEQFLDQFINLGDCDYSILVEHYSTIKPIESVLCIAVVDGALEDRKDCVYFEPYPGQTCDLSDQGSVLGEFIMHLVRQYRLSYNHGSTILELC